MMSSTGPADNGENEEERTATSYRCTTCLTCWPYVRGAGGFEQCPECEQPTRASCEPSIPTEEAVRRRQAVKAERNRKAAREALLRHRHWEFEQWLDEHDRRWPEEKELRRLQQAAVDADAPDGPSRAD